VVAQARSAAESLADVLRDGMSIAVGGFGLCGVPMDLIEAVRDSDVSGLTIVSNNMGTDGKGLGLLLENRQVRKVVASYVGENKLFGRQYLDGEVEVEFTPQGTLAERLRAGGAGIAAFYTKTGVGTSVADGKPTAEFSGQTYVLEQSITTDLALIHAFSADSWGNLTYRHAARNFNPVVATAGKITVAEVERRHDEPIDPNLVVTPGIFVDRIVVSTNREKDIEQRTTRERGSRDQIQGGANS
jgi:3-oxoacid CoA-transferase subunit A